MIPAPGDRVRSTVGGMPDDFDPAAHGLTHLDTARRHGVESVAGEPSTVASTGRYEDVVDVVGGGGRAGLLLQQRLCVFDASIIDTSLVFPL